MALAPLAASSMTIGTLLVAAALSGCKADRGPGWNRHNRYWAVEPGRAGVVHADDEAAILHQPGRERRVDLGGCVPDGTFLGGLVALSGERAIVYSYSVNGGNWIESGSVENEVACMVDFQAGTTRGIGTAFLGDPRHFKARVGNRTGWLYVGAWSGLSVLDLDTGDTAPLRETGAASHTALVELDEVGRVASAELEQIDPELPIYRGEIIVQDFALAAWPPTQVSRRSIAVGGRPDHIVISPDGHWLAYDGQPYYDGIEQEGPVSDIGLVDLTTGSIVFERLSQAGVHHAKDVAVTPAGTFVLATSQLDRYNSQAPADVTWLDRGGAPTGRVLKHAAVALVWLPRFHRVLAVDYGRLDLLDLPPPGTDATRPEDR